MKRKMLEQFGKLRPSAKARVIRIAEATMKPVPSDPLGFANAIHAHRQLLVDVELEAKRELGDREAEREFRFVRKYLTNPDSCRTFMSVRSN